MNADRLMMVALAVFFLLVTWRARERFSENRRRKEEDTVPVVRRRGLDWIRLILLGGVAAYLFPGFLASLNGSVDFTEPSFILRCLIFVCTIFVFLCALFRLLRH